MLQIVILYLLFNLSSIYGVYLFSEKRATALMSKEERTDTDKKRARRLKKTKQRQRQREKEKAAKEISKLNPGLGNKYSKLKVEKQLKDASSSNIIKVYS